MIMRYSIEIKTSDLQCLSGLFTNIGPYSDHPKEEPGYRILKTDSKQALDAWCTALKKAGFTFKLADTND